ncbi:MAG: tetratricopeptide repeat protein [Verrucomicrobiota bacterium]
MTLEPPDSHHLHAAEGWLELGNPAEAEHELASISEAARMHPDVLGTYWQLFAARKQWEDALAIGELMVKLNPDHLRGWIHQSYALHELKRTREAWEQLRRVADQYPGESLIPYNLACYACQLGNHADALRLLQSAIKIDGKDNILPRALEDPDLVPLRDRIRAL